MKLLTSEIIIKPIITEKSLKEAQKKRYTFIVARDARKDEIKDAVKKLFHVDPIRIMTSNMRKEHSSLTRMGRRSKTALYKKARVTVKADQKIDIFEEATSNE